MEIDFFLPMKDVPRATYQMKRMMVRDGKPMLIDSPQTKLARHEFSWRTKKYRPDAPIESPVELYVQWRFPLTKRSKEGQWKTTRPDTDNLNKMLKDVLTANGYWKDDSYVVREIIEKIWSENSGIHIKIKVLDSINTEG